MITLKTLVAQYNILYFEYEFKFKNTKSVFFIWKLSKQKPLIISDDC